MNRGPSIEDQTAQSLVRASDKQLTSRNGAVPCIFSRNGLYFRPMSLAISGNDSRNSGTAKSFHPSPTDLAKAPAKSPQRFEPVPSEARGDSFEASGQAAPTPTDPSRSADPQTDADRESQKPSAEPKAIGRQLTPDDLEVISNLQARDREVRAHEAAHQAAGGGAVGGASYSYQQGPDGRQYAIGGEVSVDLSASGGPEAVIAQMARVRAAATAPASPSAQDLSVAAAASSIAAAARQELQTQEFTEQTKATETKEKKAEATAELDAKAGQAASSASPAPGASTDDVAKGSAKIPVPDAQTANQRTQQQRDVSAYQTSSGEAKSSINQYA